MSPVYSRLVLFDIDGTLVHCGPTPRRVFKWLLTRSILLRRRSLPDEPKKRVCPGVPELLGAPAPASGCVERRG